MKINAKENTFSQEMTKHKALVKKAELEDRIKQMLREDVIQKKEYHLKMKMIADNIGLIEFSVANPKAVNSLE